MVRHGLKEAAGEPRGHRAPPAGEKSSTTGRLAEAIRAAASVVALTGAGISVPSGIPDFRSPGTGLWENVDPMAVAHIDVFRRDPERFWRFYGHRFQMLEGIRPNPAHFALAELERRGLLEAVITQNIDGLHTCAGTQELVEVHGTIYHSSCGRCARTFGIDEVRYRQRHDEHQVPRCDCGTALKPDVVLFGERLPMDALRRARDLAAAADLLLCIGSSLEVHPVAQLPQVTLSGGGSVAIITQGPTPVDDIADFRLWGDIVEELSGILDALARQA